MTAKLIKITTAEAVVNYFKGHIKSGLLAPGEKLPSERELQGILEVSRFSLREGLARLSALGLLKISPGKGAFVSEEASARSLENVLIPMIFSQDDKILEDLMDARALIEGEAAAQAALRRSESDLIKLTDILDRSESELDNPAVFGRLDFNFHHELVRISDNRFYMLMIDALSDSVRSFLGVHALPPENRKAAAGSHRQILAAIQDKNAEACRELTHRHIHRCKRNFKIQDKKKDLSHAQTSL